MKESYRGNLPSSSGLIEKVSGPVHDVVNLYEPNRDVLDTKTNKAGTFERSKYDYAVNEVGQRTAVSTSGTAFPSVPSWLWGYDGLGQVVSADSSVSTSDRAYEYDAIGNRKKSANSLTLPSTDNYTTNALNQYSSLALNSQAPTLNPSYDFDGNMTSGPLPTAPTVNSNLTWDAENRLTSTTVGSITTTTLYDAQSRRIAKTTGGNTAIYLYDAWNCIAEYSRSVGVSPTLQTTRLWGTDLSGTLQGAGGVGGLLSETLSNQPSSPNFFPTYDGNGNVSEYLASNGSITAHYEYDPFGNTVVNTDSGNQFGYRFSTKPRDTETGLYYYGYRYYDPVTGRWPSRDPIEEEGGINLYGFVGNDGVKKWDFLGMAGGAAELGCCGDKQMTSTYDSCCDSKTVYRPGGGGQRGSYEPGGKCCLGKGDGSLGTEKQLVHGDKYKSNWLACIKGEGGILDGLAGGGMNAFLAQLAAGTPLSRFATGAFTALIGPAERCSTYVCVK